MFAVAEASLLSGTYQCNLGLAEGSPSCDDDNLAAVAVVQGRLLDLTLAGLRYAAFSNSLRPLLR